MNNMPVNLVDRPSFSVNQSVDKIKHTQNNKDFSVSLTQGESLTELNDKNDSNYLKERVDFKNLSKKIELLKDNDLVTEKLNKLQNHLFYKYSFYQNSDFDKIKRPRKINVQSLGVDVSADSALIMDLDSNYIMFSKNINNKVPVASLTKLVTILTFLDFDIDMQKKIKIEKEYIIPIGRRFIYPNDEVKIKDLVVLSLMASDNTAVNSLVKSLDISFGTFIKAMNSKVKDLKMFDTEFYDHIGLDPRSVSTARDVSILVRYLNNINIFKDSTSLKEYIFKPKNSLKKVKATNTNESLHTFINDYPYSINLSKTGFIDEAGYCVTSLVHNDIKESDIIVVVLGAKQHYSRFSDLNSLAYWGFNNFTWQ
jgi:D-alanyl-D-alanine endopeptidase (penicillin-binding protein 7)